MVNHTIPLPYGQIMQGSGEITYPYHQFFLKLIEDLQNKNLSVFDTLADAEAATVATESVMVMGNQSAGDNGLAFYVSVDAEPAHEGKFQDVAGTWFELSTQQVITPEMFGAIADADYPVSSWTGTDNTVAFRDLGDFIVAKGGGVSVKFKYATHGYLVWTGTVPTQSAIFSLDGVRGVRIDFNGSALIAPGTFTDVGYLIFIQNSNDVHIVSPYYIGQYVMDLSQAAYEAFMGSGFNGALVVDVGEGAYNIAVEHMQVYGARAAFTAIKNSGEIKSYNIAISTAYIEKSLYGINCAKNGDRLTATNIWCANCGRVYFVYNVHGHVAWVTDLTLNSIITPCIIGLSTDHTEGAVANTTSDIELHYHMHSTGNTVHNIAFLEFGISQGTGTTSAGYIRNIVVDMDIDANVVDTSGSRALFTAKVDSGGGVDNTARGYIFENVKIGGRFRGNNQDVAAIHLFNDSDWSGETVRNVEISDFVCVELNNEAIVVDMSAFTLGGHLTLRNIVTNDNAGSGSGDIVLSNNPGGALKMYNVKSSTWDTEADFDPVWGQTAGVAPAKGATGYLKGRYQREGSKVTVTYAMFSDATTTFGDSAGNWTLTPPAPYNEAPIGDIGQAIGSVWGNVAAGNPDHIGAAVTFSGPVQLIDVAGNWKGTVPAAWANGDFFEASLTYDV